MEREEKCNLCDNTGICSSCNGQGKVRGDMICDMCDGTGRCFCSYGDQLLADLSEDKSIDLLNRPAADLSEDEIIDLLNRPAVDLSEDESMDLRSRPEAEPTMPTVEVHPEIIPEEQPIPASIFDPNAKRALEKGAKKLFEFQKFFPQGSNYEVYATSKQASKCTVPDPGVRFIAQTCDKPKIYALFAEINMQSIQKYCIVYYSDNYFSYVPLHPIQRAILENYNADLYKTWLYTSRGKLNPGKALFYPPNFIMLNPFREGVKICGKLYRKMWDLLKKNKEDTLDKIHQEFEKVNNKLLKLYGSVEIKTDFDLYYDLVTSRYKEMKMRMGSALTNLRTGPEAGDGAAAFFIGRPYVKLNVEPVYIVPNGKTTIVIAIVPNSGYSFKYFEHYQTFYSFVKAVYDFLVNQ